ncbi:MAG: 16S rRNA (uracil(1498)-N(3))-methyltransferase [Clostridiales Family XIII bacterium]|nr:16S rRNA (uracil(1498)-N(3))-methyltransferase [Clostridiales Family XIII bacterium]
MRRFFVAPSAIGETHIAIREPADRNHIKNVLRMGIGDEAVLSDGTAFEYRARITEILPDGVFFEILDKQGLASEPSVRITLFQGMPKQGKLETIIQKSVELGVHAIVPVHTARSVPKSNIGNTILKRERWKRVAAEAGKQCRRGIIPEIENPLGFTEAIAKLSRFDAVFFPYEEEEGITLKDVLVPVADMYRATKTQDKETTEEPPEAGDVAHEDAAARIAVFIGPEGGVTGDEADALTCAGAKPCSLGKRILRTETAGPAAIAMILYEWEL